ncbi:hypothetical protein SAMN05518682_0305 [Cellulosimicrobium aquatile]|uniref:Uncharacterized protein n=2 Tax=Cellulosimicrobium TaxID=157920 RepID=A0A4Y8R0V5_9MICO|nr:MULTISPECIES: hypothetical protein [Cellulosimicrobium]TFF07917.1 hypothetical protein E1O70_14805 [Cellulosimicrobium funkei]TGA71059.1 hypothetical protein EQW79_012680 [Cellulosimicrobium terreum]SIP88899.1 hypothetical protein SAMN05518682_0305 [Cellulosimicrobium aquatile]
MQSPVRAVAHAAVLAVVAGLCLAVVASGAFDVVALPGAAPAAAPPPPAAPAASSPGAGDGADDGAAPADGTDPDTSDPTAPDDGTDPGAGAVDPACREAEVAWGAAAKAQVNLTVDHPEALVEGFTTARDTLAGATPPVAVARDWAVVTTYLTMIADEVEATGTRDTGELSRAIDRVGRRIDTAALTSSSRAVTEYFRAGCAR